MIPTFPRKRSTSPPWRRFREDYYRFVYTRRKLEARAAACGETLDEPFTASDLDPYPGRFLREDLEEMVFRTSALMGLECLARGDGEGFEESMRNVWLARNDAPPPFDPYHWYLAFRERWEGFMAWLMENRRLAEYVSGLLES